MASPLSPLSSVASPLSLNPSFVATGPGTGAVAFPPASTHGTMLDRIDTSKHTEKIIRHSLVG